MYNPKISGSIRSDGSSLYRPFNFESKIVRCTNPQSVWFNPQTRKMHFSPSGETAGVEPIKMPCRKCKFCRAQQTAQWAVRCSHEAKFHDRSSFLTLTYNDEHLPRCADGNATLLKEDLQKFLKRLRFYLDKHHNGTKIRYFACGEYGEQLGRPHYHIIVFGWDFPDKVLFKAGRGSGSKLYRSEKLEELWPFGHSTIGDVTYDSAAYVAGYVGKKITGAAADEHYQQRIPEFVTMSKGRPYIDKETGEYKCPKGIGYEFFEKYTDDIYNFDRVSLRGGVTVSVPRYYDQLLSKRDPDRLAKIKSARVARAESQPALVYETGKLERTEAARIAISNSLNRSFEKCLNQPQLQLSTPSAIQQLERILQRESTRTSGKPLRGSVPTSSGCSVFHLSCTNLGKSS